MSASDTSNLAPLLLLAVRQLEAAMQDASAEADLLSRAIAALGERGAHMRDGGGEVTHARALPFVADAQRAMRALQFHDRLTQRVTNVRNALAHIHESVAAEGDDLNALHSAIRAGYTMEDERELFDAIVNRAPRTESEREAVQCGSVEFF